MAIHKITAFRSKAKSHFHQRETIQQPLEMTESSVFLVGATGETGKHILEALVEDDSFVSLLLLSGRREFTSNIE
jgi:hypothetical protein